MVSPAPSTPAGLGAFQKRGLFVVPGTGGDGLKSRHETGLAAVGSSHLTHRLFPFGREPRPRVASPGTLEVRDGGIVVLAFPGLDNAHSLGAPKASGKSGVGLFQLPCCGFGGVMTHNLQR